MGAFDLNPFYEKIIDDLAAQKYAIVDGFFEPSEIDALRLSLKNKQQQHLFKKAAIGQADTEHVDKKVRGDFILWLEENTNNPIEQHYFLKITQFIDYINQTCYLGIQDGEFHYACYPEGTSYQRHFDIFHHDSRRTLSMVLYLNEDDWSADYGGQLALYYPDENGNEIEKIVDPIAGRLMVFDSKTIAHEVKLTHRPRYSITGWLRTRA